VGKIGG
jgi:hypothetical protein